VRFHAGGHSDFGGYPQRTARGKSDRRAYQPPESESISCALYRILPRKGAKSKGCGNQTGNDVFYESEIHSVPAPSFSVGIPEREGAGLS